MRVPETPPQLGLGRGSRWRMTCWPTPLGDGYMGLKVGDIVELKSGGPAMTVHEVSGTVITCTWFDEAKQLHGADFQETELKSPSADFKGPIDYPETGVA
jgi:uncharacterized protein YodC (DUF2158 family)